MQVLGRAEVAGGPGSVTAVSPPQRLLLPGRPAGHHHAPRLAGAAQPAGLAGPLDPALRQRPTPRRQALRHPQSGPQVRPHAHVVRLNLQNTLHFIRIWEMLGFEMCDVSPASASGKLIATLQVRHWSLIEHGNDMACLQLCVVIIKSTH